LLNGFCAPSFCNNSQYHWGWVTSITTGCMHVGYPRFMCLLLCCSMKYASVVHLLYKSRHNTKKLQLSAVGLTVCLTLLRHVDSDAAIREALWELQAVRHLMQRSLSAAFNSWRLVAREMRLHGHNLVLAVARWQHSYMSCAFYTWLDWIEERHARYDLITALPCVLSFTPRCN